jgi:FkbM family methyltransferase
MKLVWGPRRIRGEGLAGALAVAKARVIAEMSRAWGQVGLGTAYKAMGRLPILGRARCVVDFDEGAEFETGVFEEFWGPTLVGGRIYEPELMHLLLRLRDLNPCMIDCGANIGFWTVIATSPRIGFTRAVAIEANPSTFSLLEKHCSMNGSRFACLLRALSDEDGKRVRLAMAEYHAIAHVSDAAVGPEVDTITIDSVVDKMGWWACQSFLIKLDVEGQEQAAIRGASRLSREKEHLFFVEDFEHREWSSIATLLADGYCVFYVTAKGGCIEVANRSAIGAVVAAQPSRSLSRNFIAAKGEAFVSRLNAWARESAAVSRTA